MADYGVKNQFYGWLGEYLLVVTNSLPLKMAHLVRWFTELKDLHKLLYFLARLPRRLNLSMELAARLVR